MKKNSGLSESLEDYLEVILDLEKTNKVARAKDIAESLDIKRGSVTGALKVLHEKGLINYEPYSYITLTDKGYGIAKEITWRHEIIKNFLQNILLMPADEAESNACRMEHAMNRKAVDRLVQFIDYISNCPRTDKEWLDGFTRFFTKKSHKDKDCAACLKISIKDYLKDPAKKI